MGEWVNIAVCAKETIYIKGKKYRLDELSGLVLNPKGTIKTVMLKKTFRCKHCGYACEAGRYRFRIIYCPHCGKEVK